MPVSDGNDKNPSRLNAINHAERVPAQQVVACAVIVLRPRIRILLDRGDGYVNFVGKPSGGGTAPLGVPTGCGFRFLDCLVEVFKLAEHVQRPRGSDDELPTTGRSLLGQHRHAQDAHGFLPTKPLQHRGRPLYRGFESIRPPEPPVPPARAEVPHPATVENPYKEITTGLR